MKTCKNRKTNKCLSINSNLIWNIRNYKCQIKKKLICLYLVGHNCKIRRPHEFLVDGTEWIN